MSYQYLKISGENPVKIITINKPDSLNALNKTIIEELSHVFAELDKIKECRVIILTGEGEKSFVAGADIKEFSNFDSSAAKEMAKTGQKMLFDTIENLSKPVIAAVNGFALGGGLELAMACHIRYASENAKLGLPEVTLGLIPGYGGTQRLPKLIGKGWANEMIFSAKMVSAQKAKEIGLVNEVFPGAELLDHCKTLAETIAKNSPLAVEKAIKAINLNDTENGFEMEIEAFGELFDLEDKKEGITAFLEKRKPNF